MRVPHTLAVPSLRQLLRQRRSAGSGLPLCGTWSLLGSLSAAQTLAGQGFDFVVVDREHSDLSTRDASAIVAALVARGVAPAVRVPGVDTDGKSVMRALDCGCTTVVVPNVRNADEVSRAVQASLFPPAGNRGCNPFVPAASLTPQFDCAAMAVEQNASVMVVGTTSTFCLPVWYFITLRSGAVMVVGTHNRERRSSAEY